MRPNNAITYTSTHRERGGEGGVIIYQENKTIDLVYTLLGWCSIIIRLAS